MNVKIPKVEKGICGLYVDGEVRGDMSVLRTCRQKFKRFINVIFFLRNFRI